MKIRFFLILLTLSIVSIKINAQSYLGTDFWFAFMDNQTDKTEPTFQVHITSENGATGTVSAPGFTTTFTVGVKSMKTIDVPLAAATHRGVSDVVTNRSVHVTTSSNCIVYAGNYKPYSSDAATCLPTTALGTDYHIVTYTEVVGATAGYSEYVIIGTQNGTSVNINQITASRKKGAGASSIILNKGEVYHVMASNSVTATNLDFTGTTITSSKPVAVYAGNQCTYVGGCPACDHLYEQIRPTNTWGKQYYFSATQKPSVSFDIVRVYALNNGTSYTVNGVTQSVLNSKQFADVQVAAGTSIIANQPVMLMQILRGSSCSAPPFGIDPLLLDVSPVEQFASSYIFAPSSYSRYYNNYATVICPTAEISNLRLDNNPLGISFTAINGTSYSYGYLTLNNAANKTYYINSLTKANFGLYVYGYGDEEAYGYTAGGYLSNLLLPIELLDFVAEAKSGKVTLKWTTASEKNAESFNIQRSADGVNFKTIGNLPAKGNSSVRTDYKFVDPAPNAGLAYYRLEQKDLDGKLTYSKQVSASLNVNANTIAIKSLQPNPSNGVFNLDFTSNAKNLQLQIFEISGRLVKSIEYTDLIIGDNQRSFNIEDLKAGIYSLLLNNPSTGERQWLKIVKQ